MRISYHNHTCWSDGTATLEEMIAGARKAGLNEFGISDHFALHPPGDVLDWLMPPALLGEYVMRVQQAAEMERSGLIIRLGIEADYIPVSVEEEKAALARYPFDYIIGSVHYADDFLVDYQASDWVELKQDQRNEIWRLYWVRVRELAESGLCDIVGHLDLPKKFNYLPSTDFAAEIQDAMNAIADANLTIEINTAGWHKPIGEAYPSLALLKEARKRGISLIINADAHTPDDVGSDYDLARSLARDAGYATLVRFDQRERFAFPI